MAGGPFLTSHSGPEAEGWPFCLQALAASPCTRIKIQTTHHGRGWGALRGPAPCPTWCWASQALSYHRPCLSGPLPHQIFPCPAPSHPTGLRFKVISDRSLLPLHFKSCKHLCLCQSSTVSFRAITEMHSQNKNGVQGRIFKSSLMMLKTLLICQVVLKFTSIFFFLPTYPSSCNWTDSRRFEERVWN